MTENQLTDTSPADIRRGRRIALLLFLIGFGPLVLATVMYYTGWLNPTGHTNRGELIQPPLPVASLGLKEQDGTAFEEGFGPQVPDSQWTLLMVSIGDCGDACQDMLYLGRQVNIALGKNQNRLERAAWLENRPANVSEYPAMRLLDLPDPASATWPLSGTKPEKPRAYLVDPFGNIMMRYGPEHTGKQMLEDLEHLMKISQIG